MPLERSDALTLLGWAHLAAGEVIVAEGYVAQVLEIDNLWRLASLDLIAVLVAQRSPAFYEWAWQIIGFGQRHYARHRGAVSQETMQRFLPAEITQMPAGQIEALKAEGANLPAEPLLSQLREFFG